MITQKFCRINIETGLYIEDHLLEIPENIEEAIVLGLPHDLETGDFSIPSPPPDCVEPPDEYSRFFHPKYDGMQWREGLSSEEIEEALRPKEPQWEQLLTELRGSPAWTKAANAALSKNSIQGFWTMLYITISSVRNLDDFNLALTGLRQEMSKAAIGDFTGNELASLNEILVGCGFPAVA